MDLKESVNLQLFHYLFLLNICLSIKVISLTCSFWGLTSDANKLVIYNKLFVSKNFYLGIDIKVYNVEV